jgi:hypothetical protein
MSMDEGSLNLRVLFECGDVLSVDLDRSVDCPVLTHHEVQYRRLPRAARPNNAHFRTTFDAEAYILKHLLARLRVRKGDVAEYEIPFGVLQGLISVGE